MDMGKVWLTAYLFVNARRAGFARTKSQPPATRPFERNTGRVPIEFSTKACVNRLFERASKVFCSALIPPLLSF